MYGLFIYMSHKNSTNCRQIYQSTWILWVLQKTQRIPIHQNRSHPGHGGYWWRCGGFLQGPWRVFVGINSSNPGSFIGPHYKDSRHYKAGMSLSPIEGVDRPYSMHLTSMVVDVGWWWLRCWLIDLLMLIAFGPATWVNWWLMFVVYSFSIILWITYKRDCCLKICTHYLVNHQDQSPIIYWLKLKTGGASFQWWGDVG